MVKAAPELIRDRHIKGFLHQKGDDKQYEFIGFGLAEMAEKIKPGIPFSIAYHIEENNFRQHKSLTLNIKDIRFD